MDSAGRRFTLLGLVVLSFIGGLVLRGPAAVVGLAILAIAGLLWWQAATRASDEELARERRVLGERLDSVRQDRLQVERLLDALPTSVLLFDADGVAYANPAATEQFQMPDPLGLSPLRALGVTSLAEAVAETKATGDDVTVTATRDGRELLARAATTGGDDTALIVTDLTHLRRVEEMRRDFVANASHELKTPVTGIWALADSLELALDQDPERARAMVSRIQLEAMRLSQLVRDLLDLARLEESADGRGRERIDLVDLCRRQIDRLSSIAEGRDVHLSLEADGDASVIGIRDDLTVIVGNLLQNAIQYNESQGTVVISVARDGPAATITVRDTGIGIPEADQERIFERFYRVDKARSRAAGGTGLGLSLIRHAVERHGGEITVQSVLGEGSEFTLTLPVDGQASD
ncbi:sensor histidine kinase [Euzebya tangerina]|uniref:sensor histidine kinase n=1 Tax=Euzebya tangerina TaxID=591198 RepID=UPI000E30B56F|nr:ATP-binding protein [Euzebya tangerina]